MELSYMLSQMCHEALTDADINTIRKARGFPAKESLARTAFENFFLSNIGLQAVMASLSENEVMLLHLLHRVGDEVAIPFFSRAYGEAKDSTYFRPRTFTQQNKPIFDQVKQNLVRKGLLVMCEAKAYDDSVQMERWRFRFPPQFAQHLPALIRSPRRLEGKGEVRSDVSRRKLLEAVGGPAASSKMTTGQWQMAVKHGRLLIGDQPFSQEILAAWQRAAWELALEVIPPNLAGDKAAAAAYLSPPEAALLALRTLQPGEWASEEQLTAVLAMMSHGAKVSNPRLGHEGWMWGCLERKLDEAGKPFYRLPAAESANPDGAPPAPGEFLKLNPLGGAVNVDLRQIPFETLEQLNVLAKLEVILHNLLASADALKIGRAAPDVRQSPLAQWLDENAPAFHKNFEAIAANWGRTVVHTNLHVARVRDLSLRVQLERELGPDLQVLSDEFVAFPVALMPEVERMVKKAGYVVKTIHSSTIKKP